MIDQSVLHPSVSARRHDSAYAHPWRRFRSIGLVVLAVLVLPACDWIEGITKEEKERLPGTRIPVLTQKDVLKADSKNPVKEAHRRIALPKPVVNKSWPQEGGSANRVMGHLAAPGPLLKLWRVNISGKANAEHRLLVRPVIAGGRVYAVNVYDEISTFDFETGAELWSVDITPGIDEETSLGGGLAYDNERIFATTGFAHVVALDAATGREIWRVEMPGPMRAAPTVDDGRVFVVTVDNQAFALDAQSGERLWEHAGVAEVAGVLGGASPAVAGGLVIVPYSSGEIYALRVASGRGVWSDNLGALVSLDALSSIADIAGLPIVDGNRVFVISHAGRMVALDLRSGLRVWERNIGGIQTPWAAGDYLYVLTNENQLICLTADDGDTAWSVRLRGYENMEDLEDPIVWHGPVLAGDRLIVVGSHGEVLSVSPYTGRSLGKAKFPEPLRISPSVAGQTVFLLDDVADLFALR